VGLTWQAPKVFLPPKARTLKKFKKVSPAYYAVSLSATALAFHSPFVFLSASSPNFPLSPYIVCIKNFFQLTPFFPKPYCAFD
jgi:hypothetical protein